MRKKKENEIILKAALGAFAKFGYKKATLEDIAGELGMTNSSIYAYASSKKELYEQAVRYVMLRWQGSVKKMVAKQSTAAEKLRTLCESALRYLVGDAEFCALLKNDPAIFPMFPTVDPYEDINDGSVRMIKEILLIGEKSGEFRSLHIDETAEVIFSLYKSFIIHAYVQGEENFVERYMPCAYDLILNGLAAK